MYVLFSFLSEKSVPPGVAGLERDSNGEFVCSSPLWKHLFYSMGILAAQAIFADPEFRVRSTEFGLVQLWPFVVMCWFENDLPSYYGSAALSNERIDAVRSCPSIEMIVIYGGPSLGAVLLTTRGPIGASGHAKVFVGKGRKACMSMHAVAVVRVREAIEGWLVIRRTSLMIFLRVGRCSYGMCIREGL